jgi:hypothetical protein
MRILNRRQFGLARDYIKTQARPLERALFEYHFEDLSAEAVRLQLAVFQNPDGGFGRALEPDIRSPSSSALATEIGLRMLTELDTPPDYPMVSAVVRYTLDSLDPCTKTWRVVPLDVNQYPHAPWWHDQDGSLERIFGDFKVTPRAGILAGLYHYAEIVPPGWLDQVTAATAADIKSMNTEAFGGGGDALVYARRLAEAPNLPQPIKDWLVPYVQRLADRVVARDPEAWSQYCTPPLKLAPTPRAITAGVIGDCLGPHLDYLIDQQSSQGYWDVTWSWADYLDVWEAAKREWRGILIMEALGSLQAYGRIEI